MTGDSSNRRTFLKAMGVTALGMALPASLGTGAFLTATPAAANPGMGSLELWLLDTCGNSLDSGVYSLARQEVFTALDARGDASAD